MLAIVQERVVRTVTQIADDPYLQSMHAAARASPTGNPYYKTGSAGNNNSGLREWIAESYACLVENR